VPLIGHWWNTDHKVPAAAASSILLLKNSFGIDNVHDSNINHITFVLSFSKSPMVTKVHLINL